jgi:hypothetical protein
MKALTAFRIMSTASGFSLGVAVHAAVTRNWFGVGANIVAAILTFANASLRARDVRREARDT